VDCRHVTPVDLAPRSAIWTNPRAAGQPVLISVGARFIVDANDQVMSACMPDQSAGSSVARNFTSGQSANSKSTCAAMPPALTRVPVTWERLAFTGMTRAASGGFPKRMIGVGFVRITG
jgi:hypothetical protein